MMLQPFDFQAGVHARIQIYWCRSSIFRHLKLELLTQFPASNDEKYINVVYIWRKFVSFYGYVHWWMTTEISVMYGSEKVNESWWLILSNYMFTHLLRKTLPAPRTESAEFPRPGTTWLTSDKYLWNASWIKRRLHAWETDVWCIGQTDLGAIR